MSELAVQAEGLSKEYHLDQLAGVDYRSVHAFVERIIRSPFRKKQPRAEEGSRGAEAHGDAPHTLWALKDVSFEVRRGEVFGLVGHNGAGKSVLLKILSRITPPTHGRAVIRGRIGSMLEAGAGFHPELTGRENIFLSGAILGMPQSSINAHFDEIVEFSGVHELLDTPVKRYSSGMNLRLAFAVVAHLDTEILLVDEVLAVGDAEFRGACLAKLKDLVNQGRTVIFVSHDLKMLAEFCDRALLLEHGRGIMNDRAERVVEYYLQAR